MARMLFWFGLTVALVGGAHGAYLATLMWLGAAAAVLGWLLFRHPKLPWL